ncbi:MAG: sugar kinase [Cryobacterium sp.]|uniref:sugar kinase n=1 Tax=unclassified Cryobacterium TaxID=2649013 RepID=UPI0018C9C5A4|nr:MULTISPECIES: sugar kinase [unclassified Cryobacterium]MCY7405247.1 sugar kinase [Cryobacterium sp.]MEC5153106.1 2-dehydro-3-deoxygluconokinase [Cryobacterium sp. CAN_C3]
MTGPDVVTLGETMVSLRTGTPLRLGGTLRMTMAGAESNVAIGLARLGHTVRWGGRVGHDEVGQYVLRTLRAEAVLVDTVTVDADRATGLMLAERRINALSRVNYYRSDSAGSALGPADAVACLAAAPRLLHVTGITPALSSSAAEAVTEAVRLARAAGALVCVDVNYRATLWSTDRARTSLSALARSADIVIASDDELALIATSAGSPEAEGWAAAELAACGVKALIIKRGADGASAFTDGQVVHAPAVPVTVRDTIGAGDAFTAGYLSGVLDGLPVAAALARGTVTGAFAVAAVGDWEGAPTRAELALLAAPAGATLR